MRALPISALANPDALNLTATVKVPGTSAAIVKVSLEGPV
jgi:hypothetical protein